MKVALLPWYNALSLLVQSCDQLKIEKIFLFIYDEKRLYSSMSSNNNVMDTWIVSYTQTLLDFVKQEMDGKISQFTDNNFMTWNSEDYESQIVSWLFENISK